MLLFYASACVHVSHQKCIWSARLLLTRRSPSGSASFSSCLCALYAHSAMCRQSGPDDEDLQWHWCCHTSVGGGDVLNVCLFYQCLSVYTALWFLLLDSSLYLPPLIVGFTFHFLVLTSYLSFWFSVLLHCMEPIRQMLFTSRLLWDFHAVLIIFHFSFPPPLHAFQPIEREGFGVGCKNRPITAQEEQNSDWAEWLSGGASGTNHRGGVLTQIFRPITHKMIDPADWLFRRFVLHVIKIIPKQGQLLGFCSFYFCLLEFIISKTDVFAVQTWCTQYSSS